MLRAETIEVLIAIVVWAILLGLALHLIERRLRSVKPTLSDRVFFTARSMNCSEYELFRRAGARYDFSAAKIDTDFKHYLWHEHVPEYVRQFVCHFEESRHTAA